jgi:DNA transposition AAA+ family ATPase
MFLCDLPGYVPPKGGMRDKPTLAKEKSIGDPTQLILVDEADRLKMASLEQMRAVFDRGGIGLVLIGMPGLEKRLARYAQFYWKRPANRIYQN